MCNGITFKAMYMAVNSDLKIERPVVLFVLISLKVELLVINIPLPDDPSTRRLPSVKISVVLGSASPIVSKARFSR